jgi:hypothetical protein
MKKLKNLIDSKRNRQKKRSLIKILYIYPIAFFLVGLVTIFAYYSWLQVHNYNNQVEKLKTDFPIDQRNELKSRILVLKDYIYWVKSHPEEYIRQQLINRINTTDRLLAKYSDTNLIINSSLPVAFVDSLDKLNKYSINKVIILNKDHKVIFPVYPFVHEKANKASTLFGKLYKLENIDAVYELIRKSSVNEVPH